MMGQHYQIIRLSDEALRVVDWNGHESTWRSDTAEAYREQAARHTLLAERFAGDLTAVGHQSFSNLMSAVADFLDVEEAESRPFIFEDCRGCLSARSGEITFRKEQRVAVRHHHFTDNPPSAHATINADGTVTEHDVPGWVTGGVPE